MACFNFMVILGELGSADSRTALITTSYQDFYSSMINVPYLGSWIPTVLPTLVVFFSLIFAILSIFKLKNKALQAFKRVNDKKDESQEKGKIDNVKNADETLIESILRGERAILSEIDI